MVARFEPQKNTLRFLDAVVKLKQLGFNIQVNWFGNFFLKNGEPSKKSEYYLSVSDRIKEYNAQQYFILHDQTIKLLPVYQDSDFFCLPSLYEGFPNVICEAMACGKPILASNVCDNSIFVKDGLNGHLFNPLSVQSMTDTIGNFIKEKDLLFARYGQESRKIAEALFSERLFIQKYCQLIDDL